MDKWDFIKLKSFCTTKEMVSKRMGENIHKVGEHIHKDKGLITRIYRELPKNQ
jgi:hypothetical protein